MNDKKIKVKIVIIDIKTKENKGGKSAINKSGNHFNWENKRMLEKIASFEGDTAELEALHTEFEGHVANLKASNSMQEFREETQAAKEVLRKFVALTKG